MAGPAALANRQDAAPGDEGRVALGFGYSKEEGSALMAREGERLRIMALDCACRFVGKHHKSPMDVLEVARSFEAFLKGNATTKID